MTVAGRQLGYLNRRGNHEKISLFSDRLPQRGFSVIMFKSRKLSN